MVDFLFALTELFSLLRLRSYEAKCVQLDCFRSGVDLFALKFYLDWTGSFPSNHSWPPKARDTGLPHGKDRISLHPLILTQYWSVTDGRTDIRTDGRICRSIYSACKASFASHCKNASNVCCSCIVSTFDILAIKCCNICLLYTSPSPRD